ncbi:MAG: PQQ-dependent sugar dehydrogenase [Bacteroidota bacterium]
MLVTGRYLLMVLMLVALRTHAAEFPPGYVGELITDALNSPTAIAVAPDGRIFVTEKGGTVRVIESGALLPDPLLVLAVDEFGERGLGSILLDPEFDQNGYLYVYYTVAGQERNRISRFTVNGNRAIPGSEFVLLDLTPLASTIHNGGAMRWGADGKLYVATGEGARTENSQQMDNELGKVLRLNPDGSIPPDNPFFSTATGRGRAIYALGLRNPFTFDIDPVSGRMFANDVGLSDWEEVNEIFAGRNYGWPIVEGYLQGQIPPASYEDPLFAYSHDVGCAVVGGLAYNYPESVYPAEIQNHYLFADFCWGVISMIDLSTNQVSDTFATRVADLSHLTADPNTGEILYCEIYSGKLWRVRYLGTGAPFISENPADVLVAEGEAAHFALEAVASDPLSYAWFRDGSPISGADSTELTLLGLSLADSGAAIFCRVSNASGTVDSDTVTLNVTANQRPLVSIERPLPGRTYRAGDTIWFSGEAVDPEDGPLAVHHLRWKVDFHHATHTHPVIASAIVPDSGYFVPPPIGETDTNVWYRIEAIATDGLGFPGHSAVEVFPAYSQVQFQTLPPGLELTLDGGGVTAPYDLTAVTGTIRTLGAPRVQIRRDSLFEFVAWEPESDLEFDFVLAPEAESYTARYRYREPFVLGQGDGLRGDYFNNVTLEGDPRYTQIDPEVNFRYEWEAPVNLPWPVPQEFGRDSFATRWTGDLLAPASGIYTFYLDYDDRVRFTLNDVVLVDRVADFGGTDSVRIVLQSGVRYALVLEYAEVQFTSRMIFSWQPPFFARTVVPQSQLYSENVIGVPPTSPYDSSFVYPVPLQDQMYVAIHDVESEDWVEVTIHDALGRLVKQAEVYVSVFQPGILDIRELRGNQLYLITLFNGGRVTKIKAMKY